MKKVQWYYLAQIIAIFAFIIILCLFVCVRRRRVSSNNVVLPVSANAAAPSATSRSNLGPQQPSEDNCEIMVFNEGSERGKLNINGENDCAICLSEFIKGENYSVLPVCRHKFHADCIMIWLLVSNSNKTCPICRTHVTTVTSPIK